MIIHEYFLISKKVWPTRTLRKQFHSGSKHDRNSHPGTWILSRTFRLIQVFVKCLTKLLHSFLIWYNDTVNKSLAPSGSSRPAAQRMNIEKWSKSSALHWKKIWSFSKTHNSPAALARPRFWASRVIRQVTLFLQTKTWTMVDLHYDLNKQAWPQGADWQVEWVCFA